MLSDWVFSTARLIMTIFWHADFWIYILFSWTVVMTPRYLKILILFPPMSLTKDNAILQMIWKFTSKNIQDKWLIMNQQFRNYKKELRKCLRLCLTTKIKRVCREKANWLMVEIWYIFRFILCNKRLPHSDLFNLKGNLITET